MHPPVCVRCGGPVAAPDLMSSAWRCEHDGVVDPLHTVGPVGEQTLATVAARAAVPVWLPHPSPGGWTLGGVAHAGDDRRTSAVATAWCGPSPFGGAADMVVVAEEPGVGLGSRYAGLPGLDAGDCLRGKAFDHVRAGGHEVAVWACDGAPADRTVLVGEAEGAWLWFVLWPADADAVLAERWTLVDARDRELLHQRGAASPRLVPATSPERP